MKSVQLTDAEIRALGWEALVERLGPSGALRFAVQTERGHGDYAARRHRLLGDLSVGELLTRMRRGPRRPTVRRSMRRKSSRPSPSKRAD